MKNIKKIIIVLLIIVGIIALGGLDILKLFGIKIWK